MPPISNHDYPGYEQLGNIFNISSSVSISGPVRTVFTSGQIADDPIGGTPYAKTHGEQFSVAMANIEKSLQAASPNLSSEQLWAGVVNMTSFHVGVLTKDDQLEIAAVARKCFGANKPAWAAICVLALFPPEALVEIQVQAVYEESLRSLSA